MYQRPRVLRRIVLAAALFGLPVACSDRDSTGPKFERPSAEMLGLDRSKRLPNHEAGGSQAMQAISDQFGPVSLASSDPMERAIAEWRARQGTASGASASRMWEGVESYDGDYYVWSNGQSYAPIGKQAKINNFIAQASKNSSDAPVDINVTFKFDGHRASNDAEWTLTTSSGSTLRTRPLGSFGSQTDPFLGMTVFGSRGWAASASEDDVGCDVRVNGSSRAKAWYEGVWDVNGISVGINPSGAGGQVNLSNRHAGEAEQSKSLGTYFTCPPSNGGGTGGGGYGGQCYVCQQWFSFDGDVWFEWWECGPTDMSECQYET